MDRPWAAHIRDDGEVQTVEEHLAGTAERAFNYAAAFGHQEMGHTMGWYHDIGKYSADFQDRIWEDGPKVDHSSAGAIAVNNAYGPWGKFMAYCIAGHHGGLPNGGSSMDIPKTNSLAGKLKRQDRLAACHGYKELLASANLPEKPAIHLQFPQNNSNTAAGESQGFTAAFFIRMLYSCLVDGDYLDTEAFMKGEDRQPTGEPMAELISKFAQGTAKYANPTKDIDHMRNQILSNCQAAGAKPQGIYSLTVPTGGGKTIASLAFALSQVKTWDLQRIIYVIPYTSIIEQNAAVFRDIMGPDNVLEHHSAFDFGDREDNPDYHRLATENWDMPLVVTTNVQFFESLFANRSSRCRKLHNLANSVIIFDEAQMLPIDYLKPSLLAISELVTNYGCTAVLCSATQPALDELFPEKLKPEAICTNTEQLHEFFQRTQLQHIGSLRDEELVERLQNTPQVLCIVNSRSQAQNIYQLMEQEEGVFHLSTLMYSEHRQKTLKTIRSRLHQQLPCKVISTSLIEAGVDVDFPTVYRAEAGLDSQIQAAGRCNREGKRPLSESFVYIFEAEEKYRRHLAPSLKRPLAAAKLIQQTYPDVTRPEAMKAYFQNLYHSTGEGLDKKDILKTLADTGRHLSIPFEEIANQFKLIEENTYAVIIPAEKEARDALTRLEAGQWTRENLRLLQRYSVNIFPQAYEALKGVGGVELLVEKDSQLGFLTDVSRYDWGKGLIIPDSGGEAVFC